MSRTPTGIGGMAKRMFTRVLSSSNPKRRPGEDNPLLAKRQSFGDLSTAEFAHRFPLDVEKDLVVTKFMKRDDPPPHIPFGFWLQYFAVGIIYGGLPSTLYGFFLGYLNVDGYVYSTAATVTMLPWSFKFVFGMINDRVPIFGYHRKSYMVLGWSICFASLVFLSLMPLPDPYWCVGADGQYIRTVSVEGGGSVAAAPCNPKAAQSAGPFAFLMMMGSFGYCIADVAADGLTITFAMNESEETRGKTQTEVYFARTCGNVVAVALIGVGMNGYLYNGSFSWGLSFSQICSIFTAPAAIMIPVSWAAIIEPAACAQEQSFRDYIGSLWKLLQSRAMLYVILYQFLTPLIGGIGTTASGEVKQYWAEVKTFQNACFSLVGLVLFAFGLWLVKKHFLNFSWRKMMLITTVFLNLLDMPFSYCTIFGIVRNQYLYLGETVLAEIPAAANFVVSTFVIVEMAQGGDEGIIYGLLSTAYNLGSPFAQAISNQVFGLFKPSLSVAGNYIEDTPEFRQTVALSFLVSYFLAFASLALLPLLPEQKRDAQNRKKQWESRRAYGIAILVLLIIGFSYSLLVNLLVLFPTTMCLRIAGGQGC